MITLEMIHSAAANLEGQAQLTPLLTSDLANQALGGKLLVKAENLQRTGSFKFRGAYNKLACLSAEQRNRGVVSYSSGNHAQAVALAARLFNTAATIVMPSDAPAVKISSTRDLGATVVLYDRKSESREALGERVRAETGAVLVPPFDDWHVMAGQGTIGLEIVSQLKATPQRADALIAGASGGGLLAGISTVLREISPQTALHSAEPEGFDDLRRSLISRKRETNASNGRSICDALLSPSPGEKPFSILDGLAAPGYAVTDDEVRHAIHFAFRYFRIVLEPGGAAALAAVTSGKHDARDRVTVVVASGGNVDDALFREAIGTGIHQLP